MVRGSAGPNTGVGNHEIANNSGDGDDYCVVGEDCDVGDDDNDDNDKDEDKMRMLNTGC